MADNDIYNSKKQYETALRKFKDGSYLKPPTRKTDLYYIVNPKNLKYFEQLIKEFDFRDLSYMRRNGFFKVLKRTAYYIKKDLKDVTREDVKELIGTVNKKLNPTTMRDYVDKNKFIWKTLFPEKDSKGRALDDVVPHPWRFKFKIDKSRKKDREDKFTDTEYMKLQKSMGKNPMYQLWFSMIYNNLARPQELCYIDTSNVEIKDNYARVRISQHGKEGTKTLQLVDNYYYLLRWLEIHPLYDSKHPDKKGIPLFVTQSNYAKNQRLTPKAANKYVQSKLKELGINKRLTNYSFKRNGVTHKYISGEPAQNIQKIANWTSTDQLKIYDLSEQEEFLQKELEDKGIIKTGSKQKKVSYKVCSFCNAINTVSATKCSKCQRSLDREQILKEEANKDKKLEDMEKKLNLLLDSLPLETLKRMKAEKLKKS